MSQIVDAIYDGEVLRPDEALSLEPNTRVRIVVEVLLAPTRPTSFLKTARSLDLSGPPDWSANLDEYLYGDADRPR
jgi:predicted DNA-binding antitoxin AbrB/MazE fold protein